MRAVVGLLLFVASGCAPRSGEPASAPAPGAPPPPVRPPGPGASGCVESRELKEFVLALESQRQSSRAAALSALALKERAAPSEFAPSVAGKLGDVYEREGKRFAVVALQASASAPVLSLAVQGSSIHPLEERAQAHAVPLLVCGVNSCAGPSTGQPLAAVRPLAVELAQGEELGAPVRFSYDYWWAQVSYDRQRACPAEAAEAARARVTAP